MMADTATHYREGVLPPDHFIGFSKTTLADKVDINGHIYIGRAGVLAGRIEEGRAHRGRAAFIPDMGFILVPEIPYGAEHWVRRRLAQAAEGGILNLLPQFNKKFDIPFPALALGYTLQYLQHPGSTNTARGALTARLILNKLQEEFGQVHHASILIHYDEAAGTHDSSQGSKGFIIDGHIKVFSRDAPA
jgi:hypothetical protein